MTCPSKKLSEKYLRPYKIIVGVAFGLPAEY